MAPRSRSHRNPRQFLNGGDIRVAGLGGEGEAGGALGKAVLEARIGALCFGTAFDGEKR